MYGVHQKKWPGSWQRWHTGSRAWDHASASQGGSVTWGRWTSWAGQYPLRSSCWSHMHPAHRIPSRSGKGCQDQTGKDGYRSLTIALKTREMWLGSYLPQACTLLTKNLLPQGDRTQKRSKRKGSFPLCLSFPVTIIIVIMMMMLSELLIRSHERMWGWLLHTQPDT